MTVRYRGTVYNGWQSQPDGNAVQDVIEHALRGLHQDLGIRVNGCSRTDRGVHALGQVASYQAEPSPFMPDEALLPALNRKLPDDITVKELRVSDRLFRPKKDSVAKTYTYVIGTGQPNCFLSDLALFDPACTRLDDMKQALKQMEGTHDFSAFTVEAERPADCSRTLYAARLDAFDDYLCLSFTGSSFLYRMVRRLVGALLQIGRGKRAPEWISELLSGTADPEDIGTAPPQGLYLMQVYYDQVPEKYQLPSLPFLL